MRPLSLALALLLAAWPLRSGAAQANQRIDVLNETVRFRRVFLGDSTKLWTCSVYSALGRPADFPRGLSSDTRALLDGSLDGCGRTRVPETAIVVDSIVVGDSTATVHATVWRGEYEHLETLNLAKSPITRRDGTTLWFVHRLTVFGLLIVERLPQGRYPAPR